MYVHVPTNPFDPVKVRYRAVDLSISQGALRILLVRDVTTSDTWCLVRNGERWRLSRDNWQREYVHWEDACWDLCDHMSEEESAAWLAGILGLRWCRRAA